MNVATEINKEVLGQIAAESINKIQERGRPERQTSGQCDC
jgi:hypothetical protein